MPSRASTLAGHRATQALSRLFHVTFLVAPARRFVRVSGYAAHRVVQFAQHGLGLGRSIGVGDATAD